MSAETIWVAVILSVMALSALIIAVAMAYSIWDSR